MKKEALPEPWGTKAQPADEGPEEPALPGPPNADNSAESENLDRRVLRGREGTPETNAAAALEAEEEAADAEAAEGIEAAVVVEAGACAGCPSPPIPAAAARVERPELTRERSEKWMTSPLEPPPDAEGCSAAAKRPRSAAIAPGIAADSHTESCGLDSARPSGGGPEADAGPLSSAGGRAADAPRLAGRSPNIPIAVAAAAVAG